ncbi:hypothetical protein RJP21_01600 [Paenibacillus sp. VCA1]|uniref:hypothetical protein n=1 Tax=Paenibacillus sp. VCA1 TaxID=3039148 RepID=UPI0028714FB1|nr:hypothetical protein [Paenibacillus sp. VCA1]MDR9852291.1 hypothetical protein [Paenibacillus sp. VCA1]
MRKLYVALVALCLFLSACGSPFDKAMREGKAALKEERYKDVEKLFNDVLIDNPRNKDAKTLLEQARTQRIELEMKDKIKSYRQDTAKLGIRLLVIRQIPGIIKQNLEFHEQKYNNLLDVEKEIDEIASKYKEYPKIISIHEHMQKSISYLIEAQALIISLKNDTSEQLSKEEVIKDLKIYTHKSYEETKKYIEGLISIEKEYGINPDPFNK